MTKHVAVAGAGLGGLRAAEHLRAAGHDGPITVIGAESHLPYNRPPLSKELLAHELGDQPDDPAQLHEKVAFRRRASVADVTFRLGTAVTAADLDARRLTLDDGGTIGFDGLVIATGIRPRRLDVPGPAAGRHVIRTLDDTLGLRAELRSLLAIATLNVKTLDVSTVVNDRPRVVVVGGGFIGCETACTARAVGCDVTVVEPAGEPMQRVLGAELAAAIKRFHEKAGIRFIIGQGVTGYTGDYQVTGVVLSNGTMLPAQIVVEAIGSVPNTEWLADAGLDITDGVRTANNLAAITDAIPGAPVVAVGDIARFPNPLFDDVPRRVEHWSMPTDTARRAAATLHGLLTGGPPDPAPFRPVPSFWSDQGELRLQSFGAPALADRVMIAEGDPDQPAGGLLAQYHRGTQYVGSVAVNLPPARQRELRAALTV